MMLAAQFTAAQTNLQSPGGAFTLTFSLNNAGEPTYRLTYKRKAVVKESRLGLELKDLPQLKSGFSMVSYKYEGP